MKPGEMILPSASIVFFTLKFDKKCFSDLSLTSSCSAGKTPIIFPLSTTMSDLNLGAPVPSITSPFFIWISYVFIEKLFVY